MTMIGALGSGKARLPASAKRGKIDREPIFSGTRPAAALVWVCTVVGALAGTIFGAVIGASMGIATGGTAIAATVPLALLGCYFGGRIGRGIGKRI